jgi:hypothetical protein
MNQGKTDPAGVPLELRVIPRQEVYKLHLGGHPPEAFQRFAEESQKPPYNVVRDYPPTPEVDLVIEIRNTGSRDLTVLLGGTTHSMLLHLDGPGAVNFSPVEPVVAMMFTPAVIPLPVGGVYSVPCRRLPMPELPATAAGRSLAYWTLPGDYTLTAHWTAGVSPKPAGAEEVQPNPGFGYVKVTSTPARVHVTA